MKITAPELLVAFVISLCLGCGESTQQPWETKADSSGKTNPKPKEKDVANNDAADNAAEPPHQAAEKSGELVPVNPHGAMHMPGMEASAVMDNDGKLDLDNLHFTVPKSWIRKTPGMMSRAEYAIPTADGDKENARLTVSQASGTLEANIDRWKSQFTKLENSHQDAIDVDKVKVATVDFSGTFVGMMGSGEPHEGYRMLGAIADVPGEKGMLFIKCYGPAKTMAAHADEIKAFIRSLKVEK